MGMLLHCGPSWDVFIGSTDGRRGGRAHRRQASLDVQFKLALGASGDVPVDDNPGSLGNLPPQRSVQTSTEPVVMALGKCKLQIDARDIDRVIHRHDKVAEPGMAAKPKCQEPQRRVRAYRNGKQQQIPRRQVTVTLLSFVQGNLVLVKWVHIFQKKQSFVVCVSTKTGILRVYLSPWECNWTSSKPKKG